MGDWKRIFGEGKSAESVIEAINGNWEQDWSVDRLEIKRKKEETEQQRYACFNGDGALKINFIQEISTKLSKIENTSHNNGLLSSIYNEINGFEALDTEYLIPEELSYLVDEISKGMRGVTPYVDATPYKTRESAEWLIRCFSTMIPGTDLRLVVPRFNATIAKMAFSFFDDSNERLRTVKQACVPALAIAYARARGVIAQEELVNAATQLATSVQTRKWEDEFLGENDREDLWIQIIASAAETSSRNGCNIVRYAVAGHLSPHINQKFTNCESDIFWGAYGDKLFSDLHSIPLGRIRIVDLNLILEQLSPYLLSSKAT